MTTIVDIARQAKVSVSTVSHVLNGTRHVAPTTASAVRDVIDRAGYSPNAVARALKTSRTRTVGIAVSVACNPYFGDIVGAIEKECARLGMMVFLSDTPRRSRHRARGGAGAGAAPRRWPDPGAERRP